MSAKHAHRVSAGKLCQQSPFAANVDAHEVVEGYQLGAVDCPDCLARLADTHAAVAAFFRARLVALSAPKRCRAYDALCINPSYCDARDACCAGDPACRAEVP